MECASDKGSIEEVVGVFLDGENNVRVVVRKTPTTSSILPLIILPSSIAASSRNRGNYQHIGNLRSLPSGKEIASLAHSIELNVSPPILIRTLKL